MYAGKLVFAQLTDLIHPEQFRRCVRRYDGDYKVKTFSCWNQFVCMAFGQLTFRESLRDVETCLRSCPEQLYHLGLRGDVSHSTLADANRERDWRIYHDLAQLLIRRARTLYAQEPLGLELTERSTADSIVATKALSDLKQAGYRLYIDDFGTGYSSLAYLHRLAVDGIKIDQIFTQTVGTESITATVIPQILEMARQLELQVIVEGVETKEQADYFRAAFPTGRAQGWLYSRPLSANDLRRLL